MKVTPLKKINKFINPDINNVLLIIQKLNNSIFIFNFFIPVQISKYIFLMINNIFVLIIITISHTSKKKKKQNKKLLLIKIKHSKYKKKKRKKNEDNGLFTPCLKMPRGESRLLLFIHLMLLIQYTTYVLKWWWLKLYYTQRNNAYLFICLLYKLLFQ